jgi:hypothetical protein
LCSFLAQREPAALQRRRLTATLLGRNPAATDTPTFDSWPDLWDSAARILGSERHLLLLDELPYAAESNTAMLSALQYAWDTHFQHSQTVIVLCGSHVRSMETLLAHQSPLFGRMTGQWHLQPPPFACLRAFFPDWTADELVATYAIVGGVPAYLSWFEAEASLTENIRRQILAPGSLELGEVELLLYDEVREPRSYLNILQAIGNGAHALAEIANATIDRSIPPLLLPVLAAEPGRAELPARPSDATDTARATRFRRADGVAWSEPCHSYQS